MKKAANNFEALKEILLAQAAILATVSVSIPGPLSTKLAEHAKALVKFVEDREWS